MEKLYLLVERSITTDDVLFRYYVLTASRTAMIELNPATYTKVMPIQNFIIKKVLSSGKVHVEFVDKHTERKVWAIAERA